MGDNRITKKKYYEISFELKSPLALGSGDNSKTDKDLVKDDLGNPYIPASSIAGVIRDALKRRKEKETDKYLGFINDKEQSESSVIFYDAIIKENDKPFISISVRDSVALNEYKTAKDGAKFDMEILEPGVEFVTYIEQSFDENKTKDISDEIVNCFWDNEIRFGGKSMRGYGEIEAKSVRCAEFDLSKNDELDGWINFDIYSESDKNWNDYEIEKKKNNHSIVLKIEQQGGLSIRRYTTKPSSDDITQPDMEQLTLLNTKEPEKDGTPVIPGTSWSGAFRHRMKEFGVDVDGKDSIFGTVVGNKIRSRIRFGETQLKDVNFKTLSRTAIDRFTGGAKDSALFTEKTCYGGKGELVISWHSINGEKMSEAECRALAASIMDLHYGFLAVGGETSIGRGLFKVNSINNESLEKDIEKSEDNYRTVFEQIQKAFLGEEESK